MPDVTRCAETSQSSAEEAWHRRAIAATHKSGDWASLAKHLATLAGLLRKQTGRLEEARQLAEVAVSVSRGFDPVTPQRWHAYGVLADTLVATAAATLDEGRRAELLLCASEYRQLCDFAQRFLAALAQLGAEAGYARAVVLARLGRCFYMGGHSKQAIDQLHAARAAIESLADVESLAAREGLRGFLGQLNSELGEIFQTLRQHEHARQAFGTALRIAEDLQDVRAQGISLIQLGAVALADNHPTEALSRSRAALQRVRALHEPDLEVTVWQQLGTVLQGLGRQEEAERCYLELARISNQYGPAGVAPDSTRAKVESEDGAALPLQITVDEELITDFGLDGDLLVDGPRRRRIFRWQGAQEDSSPDTCVMLAPCVRVSMDADGAVRLYLPLEEPVFERYSGCTVIQRRRRQVCISGTTTILWRLIAALDGSRSMARVLAEVPAGERANAAAMLSALAANHAIDVSGRPIGRFLHSATKKGVMPAGGLEGDAVLQLATDGDHRSYPGASRLAVSQSIPERLRGFHALTRARRSPREFKGLSLKRGDFDALLHTACGTTGGMKWEGREVKLRSYPSSGALYAVEVYAVALQVEGLSSGIYHYRADEHCLEVVKQGLDQNRFIDAMLPTERAMVAGAAVMFCLSGRFTRHERKYGEGGYRMLVAETGHISQNLILTAVALGLSARPFGGVFDALLNRHLGLDDDEEQFLLSVLVGHAA